MLLNQLKKSIEYIDMIIPDSLKKIYISSFIKKQLSDIIDGDLNFDLDTKEKSASLEIKLIGEEDPIEVSVEKYEILFDKKSYEGTYFIKAKKLSCSKEWMEGLLNRFVKNQKIPIPEEYAVFL